MNKCLWLLVFTYFASAPSWAQAGRWTYQKMESRVRRLCSGPNGNLVMTIGHPQLTLRLAIRNWTDPTVFTESVLSPQASGFLMDLAQSKISATESCYEASQPFLVYGLSGFEALTSLREAFNDSGITENCEHTPADDELRALYLKCSTMEPADKFVNETGAKLMFSNDMIMSVRKRIANKLLIERRPKTCEEIERLDEDLYSGFAAAQRNFRKKLKAWGFMKSVYTPDWS